MKLLLSILLTGILAGEYDAKTLNEAAMDSILRVESESGKWKVKTEVGYKRGEWGSEVKTRKLSPNGKYEAYIQGQNLYIYKRDFKTDLAVTHDNDTVIFNGTADWLYNEEFNCGPMFEWSPDSKFLAFVRLNDSEVASFEWQEVLGVQEDGSRGVEYPQTKSIRYPRVGTDNPKAQVCIYDVHYKDIRVIELGEYEYVPRIRWNDELMNDEMRNRLFVQTLNRDQNEMKVYEVNPKSGVSKLWYNEHSEDGWVDYKNFDEWQWLNNGNVIVVSARSGWRQVYLYAANGKKISQLTQDGCDVTRCYGYDEATKTLYYQVANTPMTRQNLSLKVESESGKWKEMLILDDGKGWCELHFNADYTRYIEDYQTEATPNHYTLYERKSGKWKVKGESQIEEVNQLNDELKRRWLNDEPKGMRKEFFSFVTERGDTLYGWHIQPNKVESGKLKVESGRYPVVVMHYSGPESQRVVQKWKKKFEYVLAEEGYMVVCVDVRGTGARGQKWLHETYMNLGKKEAEDLISAAKWLLNGGLWNVDGGLMIDAERMAIGGWSYGGFQTIRTMSEENSPFKCGFAIAPVTDWRLYDSGYTERYMLRLQVNDRGYLNASLLQMAEQLKGRLLIVHGLADDNVHCQNTWSYIDALVQAGKQFDMQVYPDDNHYLKKRGNYEHLHRKLLEFLNEELKK